jgi:hypothetical protein
MLMHEEDKYYVPMNTRRVRQVTTTFSGEYAIFSLIDRQRY